MEAVNTKDMEVMLITPIMKDVFDGKFIELDFHKISPSYQSLSFNLPIFPINNILFIVQLQKLLTNSIIVT